MGNFSSTENNRFPLKIRKTKKYGWIPDIPDQRDISTSFPNTINSLDSVDLRKTGYLPEIYDQGFQGSCVAQAVIAAYIFDLSKADLLTFTPSRQFVYYNQRVISNMVEYDTGSSIRDAIKVINRLGVCSEDLCIYDSNFFTNDRPSDEAYADAIKHQRTIQYRKIRLVLDDVLKSISIKIPIIFGFTVYESFEHPDVTRTGIMPMPKLGEKIVGNLAVLAIGYDIPRKFLLCRNAWGTAWGQLGYFWMPFSFLNSRNCSDLWIISSGAKEKVRSEVRHEPKEVRHETKEHVISLKETPRKESIIEKVPAFKDDDSIEEIDEDDTAV